MEIGQCASDVRILQSHPSDPHGNKVKRVSHKIRSEMSACLAPILTSSLVLYFALLAPCTSLANEPAKPSAETKYLLFQLFIPGSPEVHFPPQGQLADTVNDITRRIASTGDKRQKLGFAVGPLMFNQSDEDTRRLIKESFKIAREKNIAVAFHIDDHMFWDARKDLFSDKNNFEWSDWKGTVSTATRLDWGLTPSKAPAQMCLNSPAIKLAVENRAKLIGREISTELQQLNHEGKGELFAGVITGWETQIGHDFATSKSLGFHALSNRGLTDKQTSAQCDAELVKLVKEFIELWSTNLAQSGVPANKIYSHIAFTEQGLVTARNQSFAQQVGYATADTAFGKNHRAGFSTYPSENTIEQVRAEVAKHGNPPWISAEGANVIPNGAPGEARMETYLAKMFNHGAVIVNIFSWGIGGEAMKNTFFRRATENDEAISAYRKFLAGKQLTEQAKSATVFSPAKLQQKIQTIQNQIPAWVQKNKRTEPVQAMMLKLEAHIKANRFLDADKQANELLNLLSK